MDGWRNMTDYRAHPALNISRLMLMADSPLHYKIGHKPATKAMSFGTIVHMAVLESEKFKKLFVVEPEIINGEPRNNRLKAHKEYLEEWRTNQAPDAVILTPEEYQSLIGMIHSMREAMKYPEQGDLGLKEIFSMKDRELALFRKMFNRDCKGQLDIAGLTRRGKTVVDFKKVGRLGDASPQKFAATVSNRHYDAQAYWYSKLYDADAFYWVVVEEKPIHPDFPHHAVAIYNADSFLEHGEAKVKKWLARLEECEKTDHWPSYTSCAQLLSPTTWSIKQLEEGEF
jgi:hypothetical protein